jgi:hypothetical protein
MAIEDKVFDLMNEGGESVNLFGQEADLTNQIIGNLPEDATLRDLTDVAAAVEDFEHQGYGDEFSFVLSDSIKKIINDENLSEKYPQIVDNIIQKVNELENEMNMTVAEAGMGFENRDLGYTQAATFGGMNHLSQEMVSYDPETFDYIEEIAKRESVHVAMDKQGGY